jgi:hypothetical protein
MIDSLADGSVVSNPLGYPEPITRITERGTFGGRRYAFFYQKFGSNGEMQNSVTEGEPVLIGKGKHG